MGNLKRQIDADPDLQIYGNIKNDWLTAAEIKGEKIAPAARAGGAGVRGRRARPGLVGPGMGIPGVNGGARVAKRPAAADTETEDVVISPDELFPTETTMSDVGFKLTIRVEVTGDGVPVEEENETK